MRIFPFAPRVRALTCFLFGCAVVVNAQQSDSQQAIEQLLRRLDAAEARIRELEQKIGGASPLPPQPPVVASIAPAPEPAPPIDPHDHMAVGGEGPKLAMRGFADFNLGVGRAANPLVFPLPDASRTSFQHGEFDLFLNSKLSRTLSVVGEVVFGADATNEWHVDIERAQLNYRPSPFFGISAGRYHTSIGYYNTAYHHGTWFQTATGRPFMYYFEDAGGMLPVHGVGLTADGEVPGTEALGLHWIAELSNRKPNDPAAAPVQNFLSDKAGKALNFAAYIRPQALPGLQIGGSYYRDRLTPPGLGSRVTQSISSLYAVYLGSTWEFLNEAVLLENHVDASGKGYRSPLMYAQVARKFGAYKPYFRYQYVNTPGDDPVNLYRGRYQGPSVGLRMDFSAYVALKLQYNRLYQRNLSPQNGLDAQVAFTF